MRGFYYQAKPKALQTDHAYPHDAGPCLSKCIVPGTHTNTHLAWQRVIKTLLLSLSLSHGFSPTWWLLAAAGFTAWTGDRDAWDDMSMRDSAADGYSSTKKINTVLMED